MTKVIKKTVVTILLLCTALACVCFAACGNEVSSNSGNENNQVVTTSVAVKSISLNRSSVTLEIGDTVSLYETITPSNAINKSVSWSSSNTSVASVSNGTVTAKTAGSATITAKTSNGKTATCSVTVNSASSANVAVTSITLNKSSATLSVGGTLSLTATITPSNATNKSVTWSSSNNSVATVSNGTVTAKTAGSATITAKTSNGKTATCNVTVKKTESQTVAVTSVTLNKTSETVEVGKTLSLTATITPSNATDKSVTWSSSNTSVATVSNGTVTAKTAGSATITAKTSNGKTATCSVTVVNASVLPTSLYLSKSYVSLEEGSTMTLTTTIMPTNATNKTVEWIVLDTSVATVKNGTITAVSEGSTTLIATTANGKSASCTISVTSPFSFLSFGSGYELSAYRGDSTEVVVPSTYKGKKVISIGEKCFANFVEMVSITLPNTILEIGGNAFLNCTGLTDITIPDSVTSIGYGILSGCSGITEMTIPFVGNVAEKTSTDTNQYPFGYIFGEGDYTGGTATKQYYHGKSTSSTTYDIYYIPSSLKKVTVKGGNILYGAFYNCNKLGSVAIQNSVTSIEEDAFYGCNKLVEVINKSNLTITKGSKENGYIGYYALTIHNGSSKFKNKGNYQFVTGDDGINYLVNYIGNETEITLPENYNGHNYAIYNSAFEDCSSLTSVTIPNGVTSIGEDAFGDCSSLTSITIPNSVTSIGSYAFSGCSSLQYNEYDNAYYLGNKTNKYLLLKSDKPEDITSCTINENCKFIYDGAFTSCSSLTSITIPNSVTSIGKRAFQWCSSLTSVTIGNSVTSIGDSAFISCSSLTSITIPNSVTSIGENAFSGCTRLQCNIYDNAKYLGNKDNPYLVLKGPAFIGSITSCTINENCRFICDYAFYGSSLTSITIPNSVTSIGGSAFEDCRSLTSVTIGNNVTSIGENAFLGCSSLVGVTIPNSVTSIGYKAFYGCSRYMKIYCEAASKPSGWDSKWNYTYYYLESVNNIYYTYLSVYWNYKK